MKKLFIIAGALFALILLLFVVGFTSNAPGLLILSVMCIMPVTCLFLGAALGRATQELTISRRDRPANSYAIQTRRVNARSSAEPLG